MSRAAPALLRRAKGARQLPGSLPEEVTEVVETGELTHTHTCPWIKMYTRPAAPFLLAARKASVIEHFLASARNRSSCVSSIQTGPVLLLLLGLMPLTFAAGEASQAADLAVHSPHSLPGRSEAARGPGTGSMLGNTSVLLTHWKRRFTSPRATEELPYAASESTVRPLGSPCGAMCMVHRRKVAGQQRRGAGAGALSGGSRGGTGLASFRSARAEEVSTSLGRRAAGEGAGRGRAVAA